MRYSNTRMMTERAITVEGNTITLRFGSEVGQGHCICTKPCPQGDVTSDFTYRRVRPSDGKIVCTRVAPPSHRNNNHSIFEDSLQCMR